MNFKHPLLQKITEPAFNDSTVSFSQSHTESLVASVSARRTGEQVSASLLNTFVLDEAEDEDDDEEDDEEDDDEDEEDAEDDRDDLDRVWDREARQDEQKKECYEIWKEKKEYQKEYKVRTWPDDLKKRKTSWEAKYNMGYPHASVYKYKFK